MSLQPYTYAEHLNHVFKQPHQGPETALPWVQVRKAGSTYCARIESLHTRPDGLQCWIVNSVLPEEARFAVSCRNTVLCPRDTCRCARPAEAAATELATAPDAPAGRSYPQVTMPLTGHLILTSEKKRHFFPHREISKEVRNALLARYFGKK